MAYKEQPYTGVKRFPALDFRQTAWREKLENFPWWFAAIVLLVALVAGMIANSLSFNEAFVFIRVGLGVTVLTTLVAYTLAMAIGLVTGLGRISSNLFWRNLATMYVEIIRGVPMLVLIFFIALVLVPAAIGGLTALGQWLVTVGLTGAGQTLVQMDIKAISMNARAVIALSITYGAFLAEIFRAGIQSVGRGQMEAARSQGMSYWQAMRYIILPQAIRNVLPALGNDFVSMLKDSSLVSVLAVRDITQVARLYAGQTFRFEEAYTTLAVMYLVMTLVLSLCVKALERRYRQDERAW